VQFFQVGNEEGAKEALEELDNGLSKLVKGGVRDIVDTVTWTGGSSQSEGGVGLTGDGILKAVRRFSGAILCPTWNVSRATTLRLLQKYSLNKC
jgi:hypothetical protein